MHPLEGIRICDLTIAQFGPHATMMLADMGAEVIKIEAPRRGDPGRGIALQPDGVSPFFQAHNRGKKSITVNLRRPDGKEIIRRIAAESDIFVESWRPGVVERLELDYEHIKAVRPEIIYASATGFGAHGPRATLPAMDMVAQAVGGLATANSQDLADEPAPVGPTVADQTGSLVLAYGIVTALVHKLRTGEGQRVGASLLGSQMTLQAWNIANFLLTGEQVRGGRAGTSSPIFTLYRASDAWLAIAIIDERQWPMLCAIVGQPSLADDSRFAGRDAREQHRQELFTELEAQFATKSRAEWLTALEEAGIPCGPANSYADLDTDPQVAANGYLQDIDVPGHGPMRVVGPAVELSRTPAAIQAAAPELGQHTEQILADLGYGWPEITAMREARVIG